jgi:YfiH family protein
LRCAALEPLAQHLFTTRQLRLQSTQDGDEWSKVVRSVEGDNERVLRIKQVHGGTVRVVKATDSIADAVTVKPHADAIVSNAAGAILAVQVADCVPMLLADQRDRRPAGAVHAGWRGTCAGIATATVGTFTREFGSRPDDLCVALGPSIGACCYEVGDEVLAAFRASGTSETMLARWFTRTDAGSLRLDLWAANRDQLVAAGVSPHHIHVARLCTQTHADLFDSYRADGPRAGRIIAVVRVP